MGIGHSGGASLAAFYQAQAEQLTIETLLDGDPVGLSPQDLPPVDGLALCAAHEGPRIRNVDIVGGNHYLAGQPALVEQVANEMAD